MTKIFNSAGLALAALMALGISAGPVGADETAKQKLFIELYEVMQYDQILDQTSVVLGEQLKSMLLKKFGTVNQEALDAVGEVMAEAFSGISPEIVRFTGEFMIKNYSESEIMALIAFYKTPLGSKTLTLMPKMTREMTAFMVPLLQDMQRDVVDRLKKRLKALGYTL